MSRPEDFKTLELSTVLKYYKRPEIQQGILRCAERKEVVGSFGGKGYARRPDVLQFPADVLEQVKTGVTSFHASEELWKNVQLLKPGMRKNEQDEIRIGWDLVLDIDCPIWELAKLTTWLFVKALQDFGIKSVSVKFSGNKGFHIGVPFKAFPSTVKEIPIHELFPEGARNIALFLLHHIEEKFIKVDGDKIIFGDIEHSYTFSRLQELTGKSADELTKKLCSKCKSEIDKKQKQAGVEFICAKCGSSKRGEEVQSVQFMKCSSCGSLMERIDTKNPICRCGSFDSTRKFDPSSIIEVDTILISSRHLYRMEYSLNEKSGLASVPLYPAEIMSFDKELAKPEVVEFSNLMFLDDSATEKDEAKRLILQSFDYVAMKKQEDEAKERSHDAIFHSEKKFGNLDTIQEAIPEKFFPPCYKNILKGLKDGKKRAMFALVNFLSCAGWDSEKIEERLIKWNENNPAPLREVLLRGQVRYHKAKKQRILPPNCRTFYEDMQICSPDNLCNRIKNPVNYAARKSRQAPEPKKSAKAPKSAKASEGSKKSDNSVTDSKTAQQTSTNSKSE